MFVNTKYFWTKNILEKITNSNSIKIFIVNWSYKKFFYEHYKKHETKDVYPFQFHKLKDFADSKNMTM